MVSLHQNRLIEEPKSPDVIALIGYYQNVSAYSATQADAVAISRAHVLDGRIDWSESSLAETRMRFVDWMRILTGRHFVVEGGKAFFPEKGKDTAGNGEPVAWRL